MRHPSLSLKLESAIPGPKVAFCPDPTRPQFGAMCWHRTVLVDARPEVSYSSRYGHGETPFACGLEAALRSTAGQPRCMCSYLHYTMPNGSATFLLNP